MKCKYIILSFNLATLQQFFKKRQNRRYYHFKAFKVKIGHKGNSLWKINVIILRYTILTVYPSLIK